MPSRNATRLRRAVALAALVALSTAAPASGTPAESPRSTVDVGYTTALPGSPSGFNYSASFRNPTNPALDPPALRRLVIGAPPGARLDTSVAPFCAVTDEELKQRGDAACPPGSLIGGGDARVKPIGLPAIEYSTTLFNADREQVELLTSPNAPPAVVRGYFRGEEIDGPVPTCLNGGYAPRDCPTDEVALLGNTLTIPPLTVGEGRGRRSYFTTPPTCPPSHIWEVPVAFHYGDGVVERLIVRNPCRPAKTRLRVSPRRVTSARRTTLRFRVAVRLDGRWQPLKGARVSFGGRTTATAGDGRATLTTTLRSPGLRRATAALTGYRPAAARVRVRAR